MHLAEIVLTEIGPSGDPGPRSSRPEWLSVAAYVAVEGGDGQVVGGGASTLPPGRQSPWNAPAIAEALDGLTALAGTDVPASSPDLIERVGSTVRHHMLPIIEQAGTRAQRGALASVSGALEIALVDAAARAQGLEAGELVGARRELPRRSASGIQVSAGADVVREKVLTQRSRYAATRLVARGRMADDLAAVVTAAEANASTGLSVPVWLECSGRYRPDTAETLVREIAEMLDAGRIGPTVYLEQPVARARRDEMAALLRLADDVRTADGSCAVRIVLDESVASVDELDYFLERAPVAAVSVGVRRGIGEALRIADRAVEANPGAAVIASGTGQMTDIEHAALEVAARSLRKLDFYVPGRPIVTLGRDAGRGSDAGWSAPATRTGLATVPSLPRLVGRMGRCVWGNAGQAPQPWDARGSSQVYGSFGLETLGKNALDSYLLERQARRLGLRTTRMTGVDFQVEDADGRAVGFHCTTGPSTSRYVHLVCRDKQVTRDLLSRSGVPVPAGQPFDVGDRSAAARYARSLGFPVVVKPVDGKGGEGVTTNIRGGDGVKRALQRLASDGRTRALVEEHIAGGDYRMLVVGGRVESVVWRMPGGVVGDGRSTIAQLIFTKNVARLRNPHLRSRLLALDEQTLDVLADGDWTPDSIPEKGEHVAVTRAGNISRGGEGIEVLDETHESLLDIAVRAAAAIPGLQHAGVDVLAQDHRRPALEQAVAVCEINALPATSSHHFPAFGPARDVSDAIMAHYVRRHGLVTAPVGELCSVGIRLTGKVQAVGYRQWFSALARQLGVSGWIRNHPSGTVVEAEVTGSVDVVSALCLQAVFGPRQARVDLVEAVPIAHDHSGRFQISK